MKKIINITDKAHAAIHRAAIYPFQETGKQRPNGTWDIPVDKETLERLNFHRFGESWSETILRLTTLARGHLH